MIQPGEHVSVFGLSGCGKSSLTRQIAGIYPRRLIFDRMREWESVPGSHAVSSFQEFARAYKQVFEQEEFTITFRPRPGSNQDWLLSEVDAILSLVYQVEEKDRQGIVLIFEEAWLYAPHHAMPEWLMEILLTGRKLGISVLANAQRPANVSRTLTSQCRHVFIGQISDARDRQYFRETLGRDIDPPAKYEFWWYRLGQEMILVSSSPLT